MALNCKKLIASYLDDILKIYDLAIEAGLKNPTDVIFGHFFFLMMMKFKSKKLTPELNEYVEQLREHFIESFTCFVHGIEESDKSKELFNYLPKVIKFLQETCNKLYNPTIVTSLFSTMKCVIHLLQDYLRNALALLTDIGNFYGQDSRQIINLQLVDDLVKILRKASPGRNFAEIIEYAENVSCS